MKDQGTLTRREFLKTTVFIAAAAATGASGGFGELYAAKLEIVDQLSPLNRTRPVRPRTRYIVLHTTEGQDVGSLSKLVRYGEAHYFIARAGKVYRIIDKSKIAKHAGRSMWEGESTVDNSSIGIEVSGYHNQDITDAQYESLKELLDQLKSSYNVTDDRVLTHSMVAYGRPNRFHDENHRGRKRCGMIFADPKVRARLGLKASPDHDADVDAGRLKVADKELYQYLFAAGKSAPALAAGRNTAPPADEGSAPASSDTSSELIADAAADPAAVELPMTEEPSLVAESAVKPLPEAIAPPKKTSAAVPPKSAPGKIAAVKPPAPKKPAAKAAPKTAVAPVRMPSESPLIDNNRTAWQIARERYNSSSTIYEFPDGKRLNGSQIKDWSHIPTGTRVVLGNADDDEQPFEGFLEIGKDGDTPQALAGKAYDSKTTIYFFPNGMIRTGAELKKQRSYRSLFQKPPKGTRLLVGYVNGGVVMQRRRPSSIAGVKWNYPSTYYRYPDGRIVSGDDVSDKSVPARTWVFFQE